MTGFVVGFSGSKIFCLHVYSMTTIEVPLSSPMYQYLDQNNLQYAYEVACLGVTEGDWRALGKQALEALDFDVARRAFTRLKDLRYLELVNDLEEKQKHAQVSQQRKSSADSQHRNEEDALIADIYAYEGRFSDAAKLYKKTGQEQRALTMYTDLRMFDLANEFLGSGDSADRKQLIKKKAEWAAKINEPRAAAEMYLSAGETIKAIDIIGDHGWVDMLIDVGRKLDKADTLAIGLVANHLRKHGQIQYAREMYKKVGDFKSVVTLYVEAKEWTEAFALADKYPEHREQIFVPYAEWLAESDRFVEAQRAFHKAGRPDKASQVLTQLTLNAVNENRFNDASYYYWILSMQYADLAGESGQDPEHMLAKFHEFQRKASIYYAYHTIQRYTDEPFTSYMPEALFNISRYLMHELQQAHPKGVSKFSVLYALAKQARNLGGYKLARHVLEKIQTLVIPKRFRENVDLATLMVRSKPYYDSEELLTMCYRCSTTNPLTNARGGNKCNNCCQPFVFSFVSFEILPLVEFHLEEGISDKEALMLIESSTKSAPPKEESEDVLTLDDGANDDPFANKMLSFQQESGSQADDPDFLPIVVNRKILSSMEPGEVIVAKWPAPLRHQFFRNLMPDMSITKCETCNKVFHTDDYELQLLQKGHCPFCRTQPAHFASANLNEDAGDEADDVQIKHAFE